MTRIEETGTARLSAFVGRSFHDADKQVWNEIREMLEALSSIGFTFEDAKEAQNRPISEKVKEGINNNDIYIGILTRRHRICDIAHNQSFLNNFLHIFSNRKYTDTWTTSEWVIEEIGYALGRERQTLLLIENGVNFPQTDLDADTQWIPFARDNINRCQTELTQMINNLIAKKLPSQPVSTATSNPPESTAVSEETKQEKPGFFDQVGHIASFVHSGELDKADDLQAKLLSEANDDVRHIANCYILRARAEAGDAASVEKLKNILVATPGDEPALRQLARYHKSFGQTQDAIDILLNGLESSTQENRLSLRNSVILYLVDDKRYEDAKKQILKLIAEEKSTDGRLIGFRRLADMAKELDDGDLETSALEEAIHISPADHQLRFQLAHRYSSMSKDSLAAYHYKVLTNHNELGDGLNNLGVAYQSLGLKGSEIDCYLKASSTNPLAKANLAHAFLERGFFKLAEEHAKPVLSDGDEHAAARARNALDEIDNQRTKESNTIEKLRENTKEERKFRSDYAVAFCDFSLAPFKGKYSTRHGDITISCDGLNSISGSAEIEGPVGGLILNALLGGASGTGASSLKRIKRLKLEGDVTGHTAKYTLTVATRYSNEKPEAEKAATFNGLLIIDAKEKSIRFLEIEDKKVVISEPIKPELV